MVDTASTSQRLFSYTLALTGQGPQLNESLNWRKTLPHSKGAINSEARRSNDHPLDPCEAFPNASTCPQLPGAS